MTTGLSGSYAFNGTDLTLQPTEGRWMERTSYGMDGNKHPIYSSLRNFEMFFDLGSTSDVKQFIDLYNSVSNTGSFVACLPKWGDSQYLFFNYSGTTVEEPTVGPYFQGFIQTVKLLLVGIRT